MNILFPLTTNGRLPINNSLKKICLSVASLKKENENIKVFGLVEEIIMDISHNQLISAGVEILPTTSKSITKKIFKVRQLIINKQIDVVHCGGFKKLVFFYISTMFLKARPLIVMSDRSTESWEDRFAVFISSFILWLTRPYLHVLNNNHFQYLKEKKTLYKELIMVPNSVESFEGNLRTKINLQNEQLNVCYIKSIRPDTGHDDIIDLGLMIKANKSKILIHIIGDGALYYDFLKKISKYNLNEIIKSYGFLEHAEALSTLTEMDLAITTSPIEMMPNFVLESFSVGLPVVGYRTPGVEDLIRDGFNGHLIKLGDTEALLKCIERLSQDSSKLSFMSKNAQSSALEYMPVNIGNKWLKFYKKIVG
jgi:glycosyltransferase involved in cell wall biosynthesis